MSRPIQAVKKHLPKYRQNRVGLCGAEMPAMLRDDGSEITGARYRCGDRFCSHCASKREQRVFACVLRSVRENAAIGVPADVQSGFMVTLTHEKHPGLSGRSLREARDIQAEIQRECHRRLKRHDYAVQRHARHTAGGDLARADRWSRVAKRQLPYFNHTLCYSDQTSPPYKPYRNAWSGQNPASGGATTYIWAREITPGGKNARYAGWHVHAHYLVPTESDAHRLISAHLGACRALGVRAATKQQKISKPARPEYETDYQELGDAARYITQYITKNGIDDLGADVLDAYVFGINGLRQYDAAGRWRPLGIGKTRDPDAPRVTHVREYTVAVTTDGELIERAIKRDFGDFMCGRGHWWSAQREIGAKAPLDRYRTKSTEAGYLDKLREFAVECSVGAEKWPDSGFVFSIEPEKIELMY